MRSETKIEKKSIFLKLKESFLSLTEEKDDSEKTLDDFISSSDIENSRVAGILQNSQDSIDKMLSLLAEDGEQDEKVVDKKSKTSVTRATKVNENPETKRNISFIRNNNDREIGF